MNSWLKSLSLAGIVICGGCDPTPIQYPPGPGQYSYPSQSASATPAPAPEPQISGSQRWQHAWSKAMEGVVMGGSIAGPYGAGGGLVLGLITGLFTADSYYGQIHSQIQVEQKKDRELEAAIEQELAKQRELEGQIVGSAPPANREQVASDTSADPPAAAASIQAPTQVAAIKKDKNRAIFGNVEVRDTNADNVPDLWIYYDPANPGEIVRQEEATRGDGRVDSWSYFKDGKLVRREVDTRGAGRSDTVYYYQDDLIAREERDETGGGTVTYRATYRSGRLWKVEKDTNSSGKMDLWLSYDPALGEEVIVKEERDLDGDGLPDLWSYYEQGRLVRRDVNSIGLEMLSKQDQVPADNVDVQKISAPGS